MMEIKLYRQSNCLSIVMFSWISILEELRKRQKKQKKGNRLLQEESLDGKISGK